MSNLYNLTYNPDVLSCIANLSNDEVFTPPEIANAMLDLLPQELFSNPNARFLDPTCKTGVFLREIAKRLLVGLEDQIPDLQERIDHIFQNQLYGIAITELTSLLSRRSLYCSKYPNSVYSVSRFDDIQGNIRFKNTRHSWVKGKCIYCGASEKEYGSSKREGLETHAYEWIHTTKPEEILNMKFDVIIGNPPYHLTTGGGDENKKSAAQAKPIYNLFVQQAKRLNPKYLTMIIPSRWFAGGMGMDSFRKEMLTDSRIRYIADYANAKDCFPQNSIGGGVCYFLWDRDYAGECTFVNLSSKEMNTMTRKLDEYPVLVRYNQSIEIIRKIQKRETHYLSDQVSSISPFGIASKERGNPSKEPHLDIKVFSSEGSGYMNSSLISKGTEYLDKYKVMISQLSAEHAGEPGKDGMFRVLTSSMKVLVPQEACTHSYLVIGPYDDQESANNVFQYLQTKFVRFLLLQALSSIHITKSTFVFVPFQDFSRKWTDKELYEKYELTQTEIDFIEIMIKPMDLEALDA